MDDPLRNFLQGLVQAQSPSVGHPRMEQLFQLVQMVDSKFSRRLADLETKLSG